MTDQKINRLEYSPFANGKKSVLPFPPVEYEIRVNKLRQMMFDTNVHSTVLTSMHNIAYYSGFLYCSFGRPYACVVTPKEIFTISAGIDGGQPGRRSQCQNIVYTDWKKDNFWCAIKSLTKTNTVIGFESDHLTFDQHKIFKASLQPSDMVDMSKLIMKQRMIKSYLEIELIKEGARIADIGGEAIYKQIQPKKREFEIAIAGREAMELEIAKTFPNSELRDTWVWFQSGINTDGAHNPLTSRQLIEGDILSLNTFPMISGYYTALERTLFLCEPDKVSLKIWEKNVEAHKLGLSLIKVGAKCSEITNTINSFFEEYDLLKYRSFGYGHSFGILSHYYGREAGLELREDVDTIIEAGMVISMEPMLTIPSGIKGSGGYREHDIIVVNENNTENITKFPFGPENNIICI